VTVLSGNFESCFGQFYIENWNGKLFMVNPRFSNTKGLVGGNSNAVPVRQTSAQAITHIYNPTYWGLSNGTPCGIPIVWEGVPTAEPPIIFAGRWQSAGWRFATDANFTSFQPCTPVYSPTYIWNDPAVVSGYYATFDSNANIVATAPVAGVAGITNNEKREVTLGVPVLSDTNRPTLNLLHAAVDTTFLNEYQQIALAVYNTNKTKDNWSLISFSHAIDKWAGAIGFQYGTNLATTDSNSGKFGIYLRNQAGVWDSTPEFTVTSEGNVGVGVANPTTKLYVSGDALADCFLLSHRVSFMVPATGSGAAFWASNGVVYLTAWTNGVATNQSTILVPTP
jgi:hypothetical protein